MEVMTDEIERRVSKSAQQSSDIVSLKLRIKKLEAVIAMALAEDHGDPETYAELVPKILVSGLRGLRGLR